MFFLITRDDPFFGGRRMVCFLLLLLLLLLLLPRRSDVGFSSRGHFGRALVNSWSQTFTPRACGPAVVVVVLGPGERKKHDVSAKEEVPRGSYASATIRMCNSAVYRTEQFH
ncbi:uncharacterized protein LOC119765941 [Culex quinquefasciatus]|uniref:uncharacterized protein LOC119765941 n=1 Tax=Culex quinquefasciatus TaxID=7176 RepID=UPI0018E30BAF|nr:uncharacterized protein LOC119765941 [Culex quinquefasciatus]